MVTTSYTWPYHVNQPISLSKAWQLESGQHVQQSIVHCHRRKSFQILYLRRWWFQFPNVFESCAMGTITSQYTDEISLWNRLPPEFQHNNRMLARQQAFSPPLNLLLACIQPFVHSTLETHSMTQAWVPQRIVYNICATSHFQCSTRQSGNRFKA